MATAPIQWAQRAGSVFFSIMLPDVTDADIALTGEKLSFHGKSGGKAYVSELEFFAPLDELNEASKYEVKPRAITFHIVKKEEGWWPRLLKDKSKEKNQVAIDWSRFKDEDDAEGAFGAAETGFGAGASGFGGGMGGDEDEDGGMGGMMGGMGGAGGMGGMGMGGMGGMGGMDMAKMMEMMKGQGGAGGMNFGGGDFGAGADDDAGADEDDEEGDLPDLAAEAAPAETAAAEAAAAEAAAAEAKPE